MIKGITSNFIHTSPFITEKTWSLYNIDPEDLILIELTGSEEFIALEYLDYSSGSGSLNRVCNISLEQQSTDMAIPEEGISGSGKFLPDQEETNYKTGTYKRLLFDQIYRAFYNSYNNPLELFGMENIDFPLSNTNRFIGNKFLMFTIPRLIFGERLKEQSICIYDHNIDDNVEIVDDGEGNLIAYENLFSKIQEVRSFENEIGFVINPTSSYGTVFGDTFQSYSVRDLGPTVSGLISGSGFSGGWVGSIRLFRFWRVLFHSNNGGNFVGTFEVELYEESGSINYALNMPATASSETLTGNGPAYRAFDGFLSASGNFGWVSLQNSVISQSIGVDLVTPRSIRIFRVASYGTNLDTNARSGNVMELQGSHDGINWVHVWTVTGQTGWVYNTMRTYGDW